MKIAKKDIKKETRTLLGIIGQYIQRHNVLLICVFSFISLLNITFTFAWEHSPEEVPFSETIIFYVAQTLLLLASIVGIIFLILSKKGKFSNFVLAIVIHAYAMFFVGWATAVFCLDIGVGFAPLTFLLVTTFLAGVFVVDPIFFATLELLALIPISITIANNGDIFFGGQYLAEHIVIFIAFILLIIVICFRNYRVILESFKIEKKLEELTYFDELTGLLNERSYIETVDDINKRLKEGEEVKLAVVLMDVNNLKATNDAYGHRFGCSLVVRCGHTLPTIFKSSKMFHIGGDEFVVIVEGEDLEHFNEVMERFDTAMLYSLVEFEGKELIFSVARGYKVREKEKAYSEVLQVADGLMYENKKYLKEKYNMKGR